MKSLSRSCTLVLAAGLVFACSGPTEPEEKSFAYPLAVGNQWTYEYMFITDFDEPKADDTLRFTIFVSVAKVDTVLPGIYAYELHELGTHTDTIDYPGIEAYLDLPSGMYSYYSCNPGRSINLPKVNPLAETVEFGGCRFASIRDLIGSLTLGGIVSGRSVNTRCDQLTFRDPPSLVLPYPQEIGYRWLVADSLFGTDLRVEREITHREVVTTAAGSFTCCAIETFYTPPLGNLVDVVDYVSDKGLIARRSVLRDVLYTSYSFPYGDSDTVDVISSHELTSFTINTQ